MLLDQPLATITPSLDGRVLAVLAGADARFTTGQLHGLVRDFSQHGIRLVLARLTSQGIVRSEQAGRTTVYWLNRDHLAASAIIEIVDVRARLIVKMSQHLRAWPSPPRYAAIFGSAVRGPMRVDSDIDVLLVHRHAHESLDWNERVLDLKLLTYRWTGNQLNDVRMTEAELRDRRSEPLLHEIRQESLTIAGQRSWFEGVLSGRRRDAHA